MMVKKHTIENRRESIDGAFVSCSGWYAYIGPKSGRLATLYICSWASIKGLPMYSV